MHPTLETAYLSITEVRFGVDREVLKQPVADNPGR
jgi:hypothetical protein